MSFFPQVNSGRKTRFRKNVSLQEVIFPTAPVRGRSPPAAHRLVFDRRTRLDRVSGRALRTRTVRAPEVDFSLVIQRCRWYRECTLSAHASAPSFELRRLGGT